MPDSADLYFKNVVNQDPNTVGNWFLESDGVIPAGRLPTSDDSITIVSGATMYNTPYYCTTFMVSEGAILTGDIYLNAYGLYIYGTLNATDGLCLSSYCAVEIYGSASITAPYVSLSSDQPFNVWTSGNLTLDLSTGNSAWGAPLVVSAGGRLSIPKGSGFCPASWISLTFDDASTVNIWDFALRPLSRPVVKTRLWMIN